MGRIIAIDYGSKRTGIAITDPLQLIATPLETVATEKLMEFLQHYMAKEQVDEIVVGMPKKLNNEETAMTPLVKKFIQELKKKFPCLPIFEFDERLTSTIALQSMIQGGSRKKDRMQKTGNLDKISATLILQSYMERKKNASV
ncbi:MAG: Holliday junction resolvase RuvX [Cytophagales bacterium]|nr:Holliday junction resolvase RuvX [Bernardetiaceae bacterium]MDW8211455.1 Holliday junction resolvase RuvX [Cytophagales bacterium]